MYRNKLIFSGAEVVSEKESGETFLSINLWILAELILSFLRSVRRDFPVLSSAEQDYRSLEAYRGHRK